MSHCACLCCLPCRSFQFICLTCRWQHLVGEALFISYTSYCFLNCSLSRGGGTNELIPYSRVYACAGGILSCSYYIHALHMCSLHMGSRCMSVVIHWFGKRTWSGKQASSTAHWHIHSYIHGYISQCMYQTHVITIFTWPRLVMWHWHAYTWPRLVAL